LKLVKGAAREYKFADFMHAFGFMTTSAGHEDEPPPEWFNVYNKVVVDLPPTIGGISEKDIALARIPIPRWETTNDAPRISAQPLLSATSRVLGANDRINVGIIGGRNGSVT
jgi:hypothetical protein